MKILYIILWLIALILLIAAFLPKRFELKAETTINKPKQDVRDYVKLFQNQKNYSVRVMADPDVLLKYEWTDGTMWAKQSRSSIMKDVGIGEQEIIKMEEGKSIDVEIRFKKPMKATHYAKTTLEETTSTQTKVTTIFTGKNPRPGNLISMFFLPKVEKDMQKNMDNLKKELEK